MLNSLISISKAKLLLKEVTIAHLLEQDGQGRIRIIYPALKHDKTLVEEASLELKAINAIKTFSINEITGSVLINYQTQAIEKGSFLEALLNEAKKIYYKGGE